MLFTNDEELLQGIATGNEAAFTAMYNHYQPMLLTEAYYKLRSLPEAEDIVHEIFTSIWQRRAQLAVSTSLKHYLYKAVHLQYACKCRRNEVVRRFVKHTLYISKEATHNYILENKELYLQIKDAIKSITAPACRRAFELQYIELKSHKEISSDMKIKPQVVNNQVSRALKVVRARLQKVV